MIDQYFINKGFRKDKNHSSIWCLDEYGYPWITRHPHDKKWSYYLSRDIAFDFISDKKLDDLLSARQCKLDVRSHSRSRQKMEEVSKDLPN